MSEVLVREENKQMRILSAVGMILVVAGHLGYSLFDLGGLFPYYSFHVFIFLFVSGYFYREEAEQHLLRYVGKKCKTLLLPYFVWNLVYGILAALLHHAGFSIGGDLTLWNLFIEPFVSGHQFLYQFPAWFVPALFLIEILNVLGRKVLSLLHLKKEWLIFTVCLLLGIATVALAKGGHVWGYYKFPGRLLFMMPGFQLGRIYKEKLEDRVNKIRDGWYFSVVLGVQLLITICCQGLAFSAVCQSGGDSVSYRGDRNRILAADLGLDQPDSVCLFLVHGSRKTYLCHYDASCVLVFCREFALLSAFPDYGVVCGI